MAKQKAGIARLRQRIHRTKASPIHRMSVPRTVRQAADIADAKSRAAGRDYWLETEANQARDRGRAEAMGPSLCEQEPGQCLFFFGGAAACVTACAGAAVAAGTAAASAGSAATSAAATLASEAAATWAIGGVKSLCLFYCPAVANLADDLLNPTPVPRPTAAYRTGAAGVPAGVTLREAADAAVRNGIDMRIMELVHDASAPGYGYVSQVGSSLMRTESGRFAVGITDLGLRTTQDAVNTIAHELNHIRQFLRDGALNESLHPDAYDAGDLAELFYR